MSELSEVLSFRQFPLRDSILHDIDAAGYENPTAIQAACIGPALEGDFDEDGQVSILDVLRLARAYGSSQGDPEFDAACDLDGDEIIGVGDLLILVGNFGKAS